MEKFDIQNGDLIITNNYQVFIAVCDGTAAMSNNRYWSFLPKSFDETSNILFIGTPIRTNTLERLQEIFENAAKENKLYETVSYWINIKTAKKVTYSISEIESMLKLPQGSLIIKDSIKKA